MSCGTFCGQIPAMKLFLGFFSAVCWFNPLAWIARRKAAEDLELSCDEGILTGADEKTRLLYAELLLKNAGDNRGYTTSLSAGANSLRYRLRHVVKPAKRLGGGLAVGAAFFVLILSVGSFALTDSADTVGNLIFQQAPAEITVDRVTVNNWNQNLPDYHRLYGWQEEALTAYLAALTVRPVYAGNYREPPSRQLYVDYGGNPGGGGLKSDPV